jgi:hypothetical protein
MALSPQHTKYAPTTTVPLQHVELLMLYTFDPQHPDELP